MCNAAGHGTKANRESSTDNLNGFRDCWISHLIHHVVEVCERFFFSTGAQLKSLLLTPLLHAYIMYMHIFATFVQLLGLMPQGVFIVHFSKQYPKKEKKKKSNIHAFLFYLFIISTHLLHVGRCVLGLMRWET